MSCAHCHDANRVFKTFSKSELRSYRKKGPSKSTKAIIDALKSANIRNATLIDIGGGVGAIYHELIGDTVKSVIHVDAADSYLEQAKNETSRRGNASKVSYAKGDFVDLYNDFSNADIVTLDKVVCCYPDPNALLNAVTDKSRGYIALSFPREWFVFKAGVALTNFIRKLRGHAFRNYIHSSDMIRKLVETKNFRRIFAKNQGMWQVWVFQKNVAG